MTHATTAVPALRLLLLVTIAVAFALALAVGAASPAAAFVDDPATEGTTEEGGTPQGGFVPRGEGFIDSSAAEDPAAGAAEPHGAPHGAPQRGAAPVGAVDAGFGGTAGEQAGHGALHALAGGLLALMTVGLATHRRRLSVRSA